MAIRVGTSGWGYDWDLYPKNLKPVERLAHYSKEFNVVEINCTYYNIPQEATFEKWRDQVSEQEGFVFAVKGWGEITHHKKLADNDSNDTTLEENISLLVERAKLLGPNLGPFLWQLSPKTERDDALLENFLSMLSSHEGTVHVIEFRHESWFCGPVFSLMENYGVSCCSISSPSFDTELFRTGPVGYLRLHGDAELYTSSYSDEELRIWAIRLADSFSSSGAYVFFNNTNGNAVGNAMTLRRFLDDPSAFPEEVGSGEPEKGPVCLWCGKSTKRKTGLCWLCEHGPASRLISEAIKG